MVSLSETIYSRSDLDRTEVCGTGNPKGVRMVFANCHPGAPLFVGYDSPRGLLKLACSACRRVVALIRVGE